MVNLLRILLLFASFYIIPYANATSKEYYQSVLTHILKENVTGNDIDNKSIFEYELKRLLLHNFKFILQDLEKKMYEDNFLNDVEEVQY